MMDIRIDRIVLGVTSCYLLRHEGTILIDAGNANQEGKFLRAMERLGIKPEEIQLILATHGHADHVGSAKALREITGAPAAIHQADKDMMEQGLLDGPPGVSRWGRMMAAILLPRADKLFRFQPTPADIVFDDKPFSLAEYGIPGEVLPTPGHSPGSVTILLESKDAFVGDQAMNGLPFRLRPGLPILAEDIDAVKESWRKMLKKEPKMIYPGHGKPFPAKVMKEALLS